MDYFDLSEYRRLCLCGGAFRGIAELGALHYLNSIDSSWFGRLEMLGGSSVGAIIAYLLSLGYTPIEIFNYIYHQNFMDLFSLEAQTLLTEGHACTAHGLEEHLKKLTLRKLPHLPSLAEHFNLTGKHLKCIAYNLHSGHAESFDYQTTPELSCIRAIVMSSSLPFLLPSVPYDGGRYIDGGLIANYPLEFFDDSWTPVLGVCLQGHIINDEDEGKWSYLFQVLSIPVERLAALQIEKSSKVCRTIEISVPSHASLSGCGKKEQSRLFMLGYETARTQCTNS